MSGGATSRDDDTDPGPIRIRWAYVWLAWAAVALVFASQNVLGALASGVDVDWGWAVYHELIYWAVWAALSPLILGWARRHRLGRDLGWGSWGKHLALAAAIAPLHIAAAYAVHGASLVVIGELSLSQLPAWLSERRVGFLVIAVTGFWKYGAVVGIYYAFDYYHRWRGEEKATSALALRTARLEGQLARSRLAALRSQLQPHFLFNTLSSISVLVRETPRDAEEMIRRLSDLLRQTLDRGDVEEVPLREELQFLERYLAIQKTRFEQRLEVEIDVQPEIRDLLVPFLILQPLVENAVQHGLDGRTSGVRVTIRGHRRNGDLELLVRDRPHDTNKGTSEGDRSDAAAAAKKPGSPAGTETGRGLSNLRERLEQLYGGEHGFEAGPHPDGGFAVRIDLPARESPSASPVKG